MSMQKLGASPFSLHRTFIRFQLLREPICIECTTKRHGIRNKQQYFEINPVQLGFWGKQMTKSKKVREVYVELKHAFGDEINSIDLLETASLIVAASKASLYEPKVGLREGRTPFEETPVNVVMECYGWKLMNRELVFEDDFIPRAPIDVLLDQCLAQAA